MATRTARIELRADPEREQRIRYAAELTHQSVSAFVLDAATERAEQVIVSSSGTIAPAEFFDLLWQALDQPPKPNPAIRQRARAGRQVKQLTS